MKSELVDLETLFSVILCLKQYCKGRFTFLLFFDQFNSLKRHDPLMEAKRKEWDDLILTEGYFDKVVWLSSQNNDYVNQAINYVQEINFYDNYEVFLALKLHIGMIEDPNIRAEWQASIYEKIFIVKENTFGNPLEIENLLMAPGVKLDDKLKNYFGRRSVEMYDGFVEFQTSKIFNSDMFPIMLLLVDCEDGYAKDFDLTLIRQALDSGDVPRPGCIDWNLCFFDQRTKSLCSSSPVARVVINEIKDKTMCREIHEKCHEGLNSLWSTNRRLLGRLYEMEILTGLEMRLNKYNVNLAYYEVDESSGLTDSANNTTLFKGYIRTKKNFNFKVLSLLRFSSGEELVDEMSYYISKFSGNQELKLSKKECFDAVMFLPRSDLFPLVDFFIFLPCWKGRMHLLLMFQATLGIANHRSGKTWLSDISVREKRCKSFEKVSLV